MVEAGCSLIVVSILSVIAAIVGGNFAVAGARFGPLSSKPLRLLLALFASFAGMVGFTLLLVGLLMPGPDPKPDPTPTQQVSRTTVVPKPTPQQDAWKAYAARANAVCKDLDTKQRKLPSLDKNPSWSQLAKHLRRDIALQDDALSKLRVLTVPSEQLTYMIEVWNQFQQIIESEEWALLAAESENVEDFQQARIAWSGAQITFNSSARAMGLSECVYR